MKILLGLFLIFALAVNSFAAPLIYKAKVQAVKGTFIELGSFDASKYKKIRVVVFSGSVFDSTLIISGGEEGDYGRILSNDFSLSYTTLIELPPSKIKVSIRSEGLCRLYIYADE